MIVRRWVRRCRQKPGIFAAAILALAIGIAAVTTASAVVERTLLFPFGFATPPDLVTLRHGEDRAAGNWYTFRDVQALQNHHRVFQAVAGFGSLRPPQSVSASGVVVPANTLMVSSGYFDVLELPMTAGRTFRRDDDERGAAATAVLSHRFARAAFGSAEVAIGRELDVGDLRTLVIGVTPEGFSGTDLSSTPDLFLPLALMPRVNPVGFEWFGDRSPMWLQAVARLRPGLSFRVANAMLAAHGVPSSGQMITYANDTRVADIKEAAIPPRIWAKYSTILRLFGLAAGSLLIAACVTVGALFVTRSEQRRRDLAICVALGASQRRLLLECWGEALWTTLAGTMLALPLSVLLLKGFAVLAAASGVGASMSWRIEAFNLVVVCAIAFAVSGLITLMSWRLSVGKPLMKELQPSRADDCVGPRFVRRTIVVIQAAAAMALMAIAGLLVRSTLEIYNADLGFPTAGLVEGTVDVSATRADGTQRRLLYDDIYRQLRDALPTSPVGLTGREWSVRSNLVVQAGGTAPLAPGGHRLRQVRVRTISHSYFEALGVTTKEGRLFDQNAADPEAIVSVALAGMLAAQHEPIGARLGSAVGSPRPTVVGVVDDHRMSPLMNFTPTAYVSIGVLPEYALTSEVAEAAETIPKIVTFVMRTPHTNVVSEVIKRNVDRWPSATTQVRTADERIKGVASNQRLGAAAIGLLGLASVFLAIVSIYALITSTLASRVREIGIRMALGATNAELFRLFSREIVFAILLGIVLGAVAVVNAGGLLRSLLFGTEVADARGLISAGLLLLFVACLTLILPILRATSGDPSELLREG